MDRRPQFHDSHCNLKFIVPQPISRCPNCRATISFVHVPSNTIRGTSIKVRVDGTSIKVRAYQEIRRAIGCSRSSGFFFPAKSFSPLILKLNC